MKAWNFSYTIKFKKLENCHSLVKYGKYTFNVEIIDNDNK